MEYGRPGQYPAQNHCFYLAVTMPTQLISVESNSKPIRNWQIELAELDLFYN